MRGEKDWNKSPRSRISLNSSLGLASETESRAEKNNDAILKSPAWNHQLTRITSPAGWETIPGTDSETASLFSHTVKILAALDFLLTRDS